jgi:cyclic-di-GMP-binding protein
MPSFDIVSKINLHEVSNAIDQANREVGTRFDFKGSHSHFDLSENKITLVSLSDFHLKQMIEILLNKMTKRGVDPKTFDYHDAVTSLHEARQDIDIKQGIDSDTAKNIVKIIKNSKLKVQAAIQGDQIRITGKKRDELQAIITILRKENLHLPLQYENFRD